MTQHREATWSRPAVEEWPRRGEGSEKTRARARRITIDILPDSACRYPDYDAIVCIDVLLAGTTLVTAASQGRRVFAARGPEEALALAGPVPDPLLAHDLAAGRSAAPVGIRVGPTALTRFVPAGRALVLISPFAELLANASGPRQTFVASLRNLSATVAALEGHERVAFIGMGSGTEVRFEDQMAAAFMARRLLDRGFEVDGLATRSQVDRWAGADVALLSWGKSAEELRTTGHHEDLDFVLGAVDDLPIVCRYDRGEVRGERRRIVAAEPRPRDDGRGRGLVPVEPPARGDGSFASDRIS
jgi:phosphosulfolactate phosphohydrolase-like enzyme